MTIAPDQLVFGSRWFEPEPVPLLFGSRCSSCGRQDFPPRASCPVCGSSDVVREQLATRGSLESYTTVHVAPPGFDAPYTVGIVALAGGQRVTAQVVDGPVEAGFGVAVELESGVIKERDGVPTLGYRFRTTGGHVEVEEAIRHNSPAETPSRRGLEGALIAGTAMTAFGKHPDRPAESLLLEAGTAALADAAIDPRKVEAVFVGTAFGGTAMGQRLAAGSPWGGRPIVNVENACASGSTALIEALTWVAAGRCDVALALGVDRMASSGGGLVPLPEDDPVVGAGVSLPALYALVGRRYMHLSGATAAELAAVTVKSRRHARHNPDAYRRDPLSVDDVLGARPIADPLTLLMCCPNADGAAAAVVVSERARSLIHGPPIKVAAATLRAGRVQHRLEEPSIVTQAARQAFHEAGADPKDVDVVEVHDAFAPAEPIACEKLGLLEPLTAARAIAAGDHDIGGKGVTVNPSGGLLSKGHPPGASGLAQVHEIANQLRGRAGARQVSNARLGLVQNMGGTILDIETNACAIFVLSR